MPRDEALPLAGRVALVTGGSRGLGATIARELADVGAAVAINYVRSTDEAARVAESIGGSAWRADVADSDSARRLVRDVIDAHGTIDVLVSNAGIWRGGRIDRVSRADWDSVLDTSLGGAFNVAREVVPHMRRARFGRIVAISSVVGLIGYPGDTAYASAKAGLLGFVRALAKEVGRFGITVNAVAPGPVRTEMTAALEDESWAQMTSRVLLPEEGTSEDVARAVRFLVCDGNHITGQTLAVDGGMSL